MRLQQVTTAPARRCSPRRWLIAGALVLGSLLLSAGCSGSHGDLGENQVLQDAPPGMFTYDVNVQEPVDIIVPFENRTGQPVHLLKMSVPGASKQQRLISISAYDQRKVGDAPATAAGILPVECPKWVPSPISKVTVAAHSITPWFGVVTVRYSKPGTYVIKGFRIDYSTPSGTGWDNLSDAVKLTVHGPARPGPKAEPSNMC